MMPPMDPYAMLMQQGVPPMPPMDPMAMGGGMPPGMPMPPMPMGLGPPPGPMPDPSMGMDPSMMGGAPPPGPGPESLIGSAPLQPPQVTMWVPYEPGMPVNDSTCGEIGGTPYRGKDGRKFCFTVAPGEHAPPPPGAVPIAGDGGMAGPMDVPLELGLEPPLPDEGLGGLDIGGLLGGLGGLGGGMM